jgi:hypothetical protein
LGIITSTGNFTKLWNIVITKNKQVPAQKSVIKGKQAVVFPSILQKTLLEKLGCGYGNCSYSGCYCQKYEGNASTCQNSGCGHSYDQHW